MKLLKDKCVLITGGSRGIGKGIVYKLIEYGANVAFTYTSSALASNQIVTDLHSNGTKCKAYKSDASKLEECETLVENVLSDFQDVLFEKRGYQKAKVTTSHAINDEIKNSIRDLLHNQYGSKINLEFHVNNSLLGGMTVVIGSKMIDLSILNQVSKFTNNVKGDI